jgi:DNA invertase Pin-like site-specific DNA recombinase
MLDVLAAVARKDYEDRRRRQAQGIAKAKAEGKYRGRPEDTDRNEGIAGMLKAGMSWSAIETAVGCSRSTIAKVNHRLAGTAADTAPHDANSQCPRPGGVAHAHHDAARP